MCFSYRPMSKYILSGAFIQTLGQAENPLWHEMRRTKLTSSLFHKAAHTRSHHLKKQLGGRIYNYHPASHRPPHDNCSLGLRFEIHAVMKFSTVMQAKGYRLRIHESGLCINATDNFLAASPDRLVTVCIR